MNENNTLTKKKLVAERTRLFRKLQKHRDLLPGSFAQSKTKCGKKSCSCITEGKLHTIFRLTCSLKGKRFCRNIPTEFHDQVRIQNRANKAFKEALARIHEINLKLLSLQIKK